MHRGRCLVLAFVMAVTVCVPRRSVADHPAVGNWTFDGDLRDRSGRGNDAAMVSPAFLPGHAGRGLKCGPNPVFVADSPDLRPAPGLRIDCWVRFDDPGTIWQPLVIKEDAYQLRLDPPNEGGRFSFFLHLGEWEPRVRSKTVAKVGVWYHVLAGWDGTSIWIDVDGQRVSLPRAGTPTPSTAVLELGRFRGTLDELRIENPNAPHSGVVAWRFDGDLRDSSGQGLNLASEDARFASVPGGKALRTGGGTFQVPDDPRLRLAAGLKIDCSVCLDGEPTGIPSILMKDGEYQLRVNPKEEGGGFGFFVNLDGWEPRVNSKQRVVPGRWYRLTAEWDGVELTLDVDGDRTRMFRSGLAKPTRRPLVLGSFGGQIDNLKIENPRLPRLLVRAARQEHAILCTGRPERFTTSIRNVGEGTDRVAVRVDLPPHVRWVGEPARDLGPMPMGAEKSLEWTVAADEPIVDQAEIRVTTAGGPTVTARHPLVFFSTEDAVPPTASARHARSLADTPHAVTYHVDSRGGKNTNSGTSPDAPWRDFTNVNGRVLGPGERLLIRRGSVLNQELTLSARGTADAWAEIGAYGDGPRPILRRNGDIGERCGLVTDPDFLRIQDLVVCLAGKGLCIHYTAPGHRGLRVENCLAHHIEGLYRLNSHGIPEWRDRQGAPGDGLEFSCGLGITGARATDVVLRDCEAFQCSSGYFVQGDDVLIERVNCHDDIVPNTSPHPFIVEVRRALVRNCLFDASGWNASAGTMGVMLGNPQGLIFRDCVFRNQPDSGSHDEGGIDFENSGNGCLIDGCTFQNNAGAAIEILGLQTPQTTNVEIRNSRFIRNNTAKKLGPSEIFVWGGIPDPSICRSTGTIRGNGYVMLPGIDFYKNEVPTLTSWGLRDNTEFSSVEDLDRAMPFNMPPTVETGADIRTDQPRVHLPGIVRDDGRPAGKLLVALWEVIEGPGKVTFDRCESADTYASFERHGDYLLRLKADDGDLWLGRLLSVHVLPPGTSVAAAWEFNTNHDKLGWTEENLGTSLQYWPDKANPITYSEPVKYVAGGQYIVAVENSSNARLLSPDHRGLELTGNPTVTLRFQNHTSSTRMRLRFTTEAEGTWDEARSKVFEVVPNDNDFRTYTLDMAVVPAWKGRLRQLRLDLADGVPVTGTCRMDYFWIGAEARK